MKLEYDTVYYLIFLLLTTIFIHFNLDNIFNAIPKNQ
jgi:hypothetical protein